MIDVAELDKIAEARLDDARALLTASRYDGATYLCGYAVEVALKARVCRVLNWPTFPSTRGVSGVQELSNPRLGCPATPIGTGASRQPTALRPVERGGCLEA